MDEYVTLDQLTLALSESLYDMIHSNIEKEVIVKAFAMDLAEIVSILLDFSEKRDPSEKNYKISYVTKQIINDRVVEGLCQEFVVSAKSEEEALKVFRAKYQNTLTLTHIVTSIQ